MTIAACYVSPEGIVFGADSTTTMNVPVPGKPSGEEHHFNYGQKIFEIGENSTLGISTWGVGSLGNVSYRTLVARLADSLIAQPPGSVEEVAWRWGNLFWKAYSAELVDAITRARDLSSLGTSATDEQKQELDDLLFNFRCGFCIGGHAGSTRDPRAYELQFDVGLDVPPTPKELAIGNTHFWGWPNLINRLIWGIDPGVYDAILQSGKWSGTNEELVEACLSTKFDQPRRLPLREAIDWVHASIYTTIKAMKFSHFRPYCGGPIEVAVISSDRRFRWVRHKGFDSAITEDDLSCSRATSQVH